MGSENEKPAATRASLAALVLWAAACNGGGGQADPPLPANLEKLDAPVMARIREAHAAVLAEPGDAQRWGALGMTYEANELYSPALAAYKGALELERGAKWHNRIAIVLFQKGDLLEAVEAMRRSIDAEPDYAPSHWRLGSYLFDLGELDACEAEYRRATELDPRHLGGWTGLVRLHLQREEAEEAIELLEQLDRKKPEHPYLQKLLKTAYTQAGRMDEARAVRVGWHRRGALGPDRWEREFRAYMERPLMERAQSHLQKGEPEEAVALLEEFVVDRPDDMNALSYLAWGYFRLGRLEEALELCDGALEREPANSPILLVQAQIHEGYGDRREAIAVLERLVGSDPQHIEAWERLGRLQREDGRHAEAIESLSRVMSYDRRDPRSWLLIGASQLELGRWSDAAATYRQAIAERSAMAEAHVGLARAEAELGNLDEARSLLLEAPKLDESGRRMLERIQSQIDASEQASQGGGDGV